jgi:membrane-associated phospholipid phosphatase
VSRFDHTTAPARSSRFRSFVAARFARGEYLGLHLTVGFLISAGALLLFGAITQNVVHKRSFTAMDLRFDAWMRAHATPLGDAIGVFISIAGGPTSIAILSIVISIALVHRREWIVVSGWMAAIAGGSLLDALLKHTFRRPRPIGADRFIHDASFSFPSGHAMGSLIGFAMLAYVIITFWPPAGRHRAAVITCAVIMTLLVGASRLYLGVHYLTDVVAGFAAGALWVTACITGIAIARGTRAKAALATA